VNAIALLGRRDEPTDGVEDYCQWLGHGLAKRGWTLESVRVPWAQKGWRGALGWLSREAKSWRGRRVLVQYTALGWSRRGFPLGLLAVLWILRRRGARCVMVFHDLTYPGNHWMARFRRSLQSRVMRAAYRWSEHSILTLTLDKATWLPSARGKAVFIPVGANIPSLNDIVQEGFVRARASFPTVAVFGVSTWPSAQRQEIMAIVYALRSATAHLRKVGLVVMGRGATEAEAALRQGLEGSSVSLTVCGLLSSREIGVRLADCDVLLFARGALSTRRSSGLAALACGLPVVAYQHEETGFPLTEGGILFAPRDDLFLLADQLTKVLLDSDLRDHLGARNQAIFREWFAWDRIAEQFVRALDNMDPQAPARKGLEIPAPHIR